MPYPIVIPSRGRARDIMTLDRMPPELYEYVFLFVPKEELDQYVREWGKKVKVLSVSDYDVKISEKRRRMAEWIRDNKGTDWFWMMDDDLRFTRRESPDSTRLVDLKDYEGWIAMLSLAEQTALNQFTDYGQVGISMRQGNNNLPYEGAANTRSIRCGLFRMDAFLACEHNRIRFMGDFDVLIQILKQGYSNYVIAAYAQDHRGTNATGGCSHERDVETMSEVAEQLAALHPDCVKVKEKENKGGKLAKRKDVTIYWKKAAAAGKASAKTV